MDKIKTNLPNASKRIEVFHILEKLLNEALAPNYHGRVSLQITIKDGLINEIMSGREETHRPK